MIRLIGRVAARFLLGLVVFAVVQKLVADATGEPLWGMIASAVAMASFAWMPGLTGVVRPFRARRLSRLSVLGWLCATAMVWLTGQLASLTVAERWPQVVERFNEVASTIASSPWALRLTAIVVAAPIAEEMLMRRVLYAQLRRVLGIPMWPAAVVSASLFAVLHGNAVQIVATVGLGIACALIYERTGVIGAPIALHALFNALSTFVPIDVIRALLTPETLLAFGLGSLVLLGSLARPASH